jgi:glycosyltransferase involved in cell wall biosynthesis
VASISIVIPAYNGGHSLDQCLDAIGRLIAPPDEVIVVDDGSTDGSIEHAAAPAIRFQRTRGRKGPAAARNIGAGVATGDIVLCLDSDVCVHADGIDRVQVRAAEPAKSWAPID